MLSLSILPSKSVPHLIRKGFPSNSIALDQSMTDRHSCPCCSYILLRHIRFGKLYWRCSHCHQAMPAWS